MAYPINAFDGFVECSGCGYVLDDGEGELVAVFGVGFADFVGILGGLGGVLDGLHFCC